MSEENLNIYQKLAKIRKMTEALQKNKKGFGYMYVTEDEILAKVTAGMEKYGVSLIPNIVPKTTNVLPHHTVKTKVTKEGNTYEEHINEFIIQSDMEYYWINDDNPEEKIVIPWVMIGCQSDASQTYGSALTYSSRYFLLKYFNVATVDDDPDNWKAKQAEASKQEEMVIVKAIIEKIDIGAKLYIKNNPESSAVLEAALKKVVKINGKASANYFKIEDAEMAANTLKIINELNETKENK
jgi:hypothetical protein